MEHAPAARDEHARRGLWAGRRARRARHHDPRDLPVAPHVVLYHAVGCHLCERARETAAAVCADLGVELDEIDVGGDSDLEARYREWLPVVEIDGERAFVFFVPAEALRRKVLSS